MDIPLGSAYLCSMLARFIAMLAILAITAVMTVPSVHAATMGMSTISDHPAHVGGMMHTPDSGKLACAGEPHCGSADAETCELVCAGLSIFLTSQIGVDCRGYESACHYFPSRTIQAGLSPGLIDHPPKFRLL